MERIPYCPNSNCPTQKPELKEIFAYRKKGFGYNKRQGRIQRYQCKVCKHSFNKSVFSINHYTHRRIAYRNLAESLVTSSGIRDMARKFKCSPKVIQNRINRLAQKVMAIMAPVYKSIELKENLAADGLESFLLSQFFPTNINILVGSQSQFLYYFNSFYFHRKGRMTQDQKAKAEKLYQVARFEEGAPSRNFKELLDYVAEIMDRCKKRKVILDTDENQIYHTQFQKHKALNGVMHRKTNSKEERNTQNKLFPCNYIDRLIRKDQAEHIRETVQFARNLNHSMARFTVYSFWHNIVKPYRINKKKSGYLSHGEAAGLNRKKVNGIKRRIFDNSRIHFFKVKGMLNPFQVQLWNGTLMNPLSVASL